MEKHLVLSKFFNVAEKLKIEQKQNAIRQKGEKNLGISKLSHSSKNLLCIIKDNPNLNQRNITKLTNITPQAVSESLKKLENLGFIQRESGLQNNENIITLTPLGVEVSDDLDKQIKIHATQCLKNLSDEDTQKMYEILDKILQG